MLIAHRSFNVGGRWHTWIDFDRFIELAHAHQTQGTPFSSHDYMLPTPEWAVYDRNATDGGFDPEETRFISKGGKATVESGC